MGIGGNGKGKDSMEVGRKWEQENHSRTPLVRMGQLYWAAMAPFDL